MSENVSIERQYALEALTAEHRSVRDQLAILRQTRGQREVGTLRVPASLQAPDVILVPGRVADSRACNTCGRGLKPGDVGPSCSSCARNPNTEAGVEQRNDRAVVLPARGGE